MSAMRCVALCLVTTVSGVGCGASGKADLSVGSRGATVVTTTLPATTTTTAATTAVPAPTSPTPAPTEAPPSTGSTTTAAPPTTRAPLLSSVITYSITGGIADLSEFLSISPDGGVSFRSGVRNVSFVLAPDRLMELAEALSRADFPSLRSVYGFAMVNGFEYRISYRGKTVLILGSSAPSRLRPALAILDEQMERGRTA